MAASPGSWNSQVGVPLAVLTAPPGTELGVFEAGVSAPGEMQRLQAMPQPSLARVHGVATAAGCQLVAACDLAVASSSARFATPGVRIGLF